MKQILFTAALCVFAVPGCNKGDTEATATAEPATTAAPAPVAGAKPGTEALPTDVISEVDHGSAPAGFDVKGFAGTFGGDDISLELKADGSYRLGGDAQPAPSDGTWTVEEDGRRIRLDPDSKGEDDRLFAVASNDELQALGDEGQPPADAPAGTLIRVE